MKTARRVLVLGLLGCFLGLGVEIVRAAEGPQGKNAPPALTAEQKTKLRERDNLAEQAEQLRGQGKYQDAVAPAAKAMALTREIRGAEHAEVANALTRLADLQLLAGDVAAAVRSSQAALELRTKLDGAKHWRTADARLGLEFAQKAAKLPEAKRDQLVGAIRNEQKAAGLLLQGAYEEADRVAGGAVQACFDLVGGNARLGRMLYLLSMARLGRRDAEGAREAMSLAVQVRRKVLPAGHPDLAWSLYYLGRAAHALKDREVALESLAEAVRIWRDLPDAGDPLLAEHLQNASHVQRNLRDFTAALESSTAAMAILRKALPPDHPRLAESLNDLGNLHFEVRDYAGAKRHHEEALAIRRKLFPRQHPEIARSLHNLGNILNALKDYPAARKYHEEALAIRRKTLPEGHQDIAQSLYNLGVVLHNQGENAASAASYREALAICRKASPRPDAFMARILNNLGVVQIELSDYPAARRSFEEAVVRGRGSSADPADGTHLYNLGQLYCDLRDYPAALECYEGGLKVRRKLLPADHLDVADGLNKLGCVQFELWDAKGASKSFDEALAIARKSLPADHPRIGLYMNNLGLAQARLRRYGTAKEYHEEALAIYRKARAPGDLHIERHIAQSLSNLGTVLCFLDDYAAAKECYEEALAICRKALPADHLDVGTSLIQMGRVQFYLADFVAARRNFEQGLAVLRKALPPGHPDFAFVLTQLGTVRLVADGDAGAASRHLVEAVDIMQAHTLQLVAGQDEAAQLASVAGVSIPVRLLVGAAVAGGMDATEVYDRAVRVKGSVTAQQHWARLARNTRDPKVADLVDHLRVINSALVISGVTDFGRDPDGKVPRPEMEQLHLPLVRYFIAKRAQLERELASISSAHKDLLARTSARAEDVRAALPARTALIDLFEYRHVGPTAPGQKEPPTELRMAAFVVRPDRKDVALVPLGPSDELAKHIDRWRATYGSGKILPSGTSDPAAELRTRVWMPLEKHLGEVQTVLVSPDGPLHALPLGALPGKKEGNFLLEEHAFAALPVPQLLPKLLAPADRDFARKPSLLTMGAIDFDATLTEPGKFSPFKPTHFAALANTGRETRLIGDLFAARFPGATRTDLSRADASKTAFFDQGPKHRYLHLATHGYFTEESSDSAPPPGTSLSRSAFEVRLSRDQEDLTSGVVFAGANKSLANGILTAVEASELDLQGVELVTLSACDTGRGKAASGQGTLGLQRSLQVAGAKTVVATLWSVDDQATRQLMEEFYRNLWVRGLPRLEALRQAQLAALRGDLGKLQPSSRTKSANSPTSDSRGGLKRPGMDIDSRHPYYWAAFVLSGDWR